MNLSFENTFYCGTVVWYDMKTNEAAVLIDGRNHTTSVIGSAPLIPGDRVIVRFVDSNSRQAIAEAV